MIAAFRRLLAKRHLLRSEDTGCELPQWVLAQVKLDPALAEFQAQLQSLRQRLAQDSQAWHEQNFPSATSGNTEGDASGNKPPELMEILQPSQAISKTSDYRRWTTAACLVAAASIAIIIFALQNLPGTDSDSNVVNLPIHESVTKSDGIDLRPLLATASASSQVAVSISDGTNRWIDKLASRVAPAGQGTLDAPKTFVSRTRENLRNSEGNMRSAIRRFATNLTASVTGLSISPN